MQKILTAFLAWGILSSSTAGAWETLNAECTILVFNEKQDQFELSSSKLLLQIPVPNDHDDDTLSREEVLKRWKISINQPDTTWARRAIHLGKWNVQDANLVLSETPEASHPENIPLIEGFKVTLFHPMNDKTNETLTLESNFVTDANTSIPKLTRYTYDYFRKEASVVQDYGFLLTKQRKASEIYYQRAFRSPKGNVDFKYNPIPVSLVQCKKTNPGLIGVQGASELMRNLGWYFKSW